MFIDLKQKSMLKRTNKKGQMNLRIKEKFKFYWLRYERTISRNKSKYELSHN